MSENKNIQVKGEGEVKSIIAQRKRKKLKRIILITVAAVLVIATVWLTLYLTVAVRPLSRTKQQKQLVGKIGGYDVYYDELEYLVELYKSDLEYKYGYIDWNGGSEFASICLEELENTVRAEITTLYATLVLCDKNGIVTDSRELDRRVNDKVKDLIESDFGGKYKNYKEWLCEVGISDAYYRLILKTEILDEVLYEFMKSDGTLIKYGEHNYLDFIDFATNGGELIRTTHVYYPKEYAYKEVDVDASRATAIAIAEDLKSIKKDSDRYEKMNDYISKCPYLVGGITMSTLDGIYYFPTTMGEDYEGAVDGLSEYGVSDMLETEDGFYVIMRLPLDSEYIGQNGITLLETYQSSILFKELNSTEAELSFEGDLTAWIKDVLA